MTRAAAALGAVLALLVGTTAAIAGADDAPALTLVERATGLEQPTGVIVPPDGRLLVLQQEGTIVPLAGGAPLLDLRAKIRFDGEQGLLGLAFHPDAPDDPRLYVHYTDRSGDTRVVEYERGPSGLRETRVLLSVEQPYENHKGGNLVFGNDGLLYVGLGDGGGAFDADDRSQDPASRLGKLLRLDVDRPGARWELVALGLRNPWRVTSDAATGDLWIGDVGQDLQEEVDRLPSGGAVPVDYGWPRHEGDRLHARRARSGVAPLVAPEHTYGRALGCSIVGGPVLRETELPLEGRYLYGDFCTGRLWSLPVGPDGRAGAARAEQVAVPGLVSIDAAPDGRLFLTSVYGLVYEVLAPA